MTDPHTPADTKQLDGDGPTARVPHTVTAIRGAVPARLRAVFQAELDEAIDSGEMTRVDAVKDRWWARALWQVDASIRAAYTALKRGAADDVERTAGSSAPSAEPPASSSESTHAGSFPRDEDRSLDELVRAKRSKPIEDVRELTADGVFATDTEVDEFVAFYRAERRLGFDP